MKNLNANEIFNFWEQTGNFWLLLCGCLDFGLVMAVEGMLVFNIIKVKQQNPKIYFQ